MADRVLAVPTALIGTAMAQVYTVDAAKLTSNDVATMRTMFLGMIRKLALFGALPFLLISFYGEPIFRLGFGLAWMEAGAYARWIAIMQYVAFVIWPVMPTLNLLERQAWQLGWDLSRMALTFGVIGLAHFMDASARTAIAAYCCAMTLGYIAHPILSLLAISRHVRSTKRLVVMKG